VELPDPQFHFDWENETDKQDVGDQARGAVNGRSRKEPVDKVEAGLARLGLGHVPKSRSTSDYRYSATPPGSSSISAHSSASSAHLLTDASTASGSSLVPTPPNGAPLHSRSASSHVSGSGGSDAGRTGKVYGGRQFQRVVSAPLTRSREGQSEVDDISVSNLWYLI
jgi:serine/threonine-protein kinase TTK/MPS1